MPSESKPHSSLFTDFALVREGLMEAGHPTGGARLSALDRIEEQNRALRACCGDANVLVERLEEQLEGERKQLESLRKLLMLDDERTTKIAVFWRRDDGRQMYTEMLPEALAPASSPAKERP